MTPNGTAERLSLTTDRILPKLVRLSIPTIGIQVVQIAYSFANMLWLGRLSSQAVAASGLVGVFIWLSLTLQCYGSKGAEIGVSQSLGSGDLRAARGFLQSSLSLSLLLGLAVGGCFLVFRRQLIGFFDVADTAVVNSAVAYLSLMALSIPLAYVNSVVAAAFISSGNSAQPFYVNLICVALNAAIDPVLILVAGWGIQGAAIATIFSQGLSVALLLLAMRRYRHEAFLGIRLWRLPQSAHIAKIARWGSPVAFETFCFTFFVLVISRLVASFGADAVTAQRIGSQVDSFSYLISAGFAAALTAFIGQNYGAGQLDRIRKGFCLASILMLVWGALATLNLLLLNRFFLSVILPGNESVGQIGASYLRIFALCQLAACLEGVGSSVFRGIGKTLAPSLISVITNVLRVVLAWFLSRSELAEDGIWWAMAISGLLRGASVYVMGFVVLGKERACKLQPVASA